MAICDRNIYFWTISFFSITFANIPCFTKRVEATLSTNDAVQLLLELKADDPKSEGIPFRSRDHCIFVFPLSAFKDWRDLLSHPHGSFKLSAGGRPHYFSYGKSTLLHINRATVFTSIRTKPS